MTLTMTNGRQRKSLATEIDRLEATVDALAIGLNEAVATVVEKVVEKIVREAVQAAVAEVLANADLRKKLMPQVKSEPSKISKLVTAAVRNGTKGWRWLTTKASKAWQTVRTFAGIASTVTASKTRSSAHWAIAKLQGAWLRARLLGCLALRLRKPLLIAGAAGLLVGVGCFFAGALVASMASGFSTMLLSLFAQAFRPMWQYLPGFRLKSS